MSGETGAQRPRKHKKRRKQTDYSKQMIADIRSLLWVVMAKSDHKRGGITYETAKANGFLQAGDVSENSPRI